MNTKKIKWGIIGLGNIANQFAFDLALVDSAELYAVASRSLENANAFAQKHQATVAYNDYEALINDPLVDIIYIATPHDSHSSLAVQALNAKKHVLCEKPVALNQKQATKMVDAAKANNCFFMEAFWTRFNPSFQQALLKIKQGELGEIRYINADFSYLITNPGGRMTNMELGGGSLLDMGVYPLMLAYTVLGKPEKVLASALFFESGADQQTAMILQYKNAQAVLQSSFMSHSNMAATISGSAGRINLNAFWHEAQGFNFTKNDHQTDYSFPTKGRGFTYEIEECHQCIEKGAIESTVWSHQNCLDLITIVDAVRSQTGLKYAIDED